MYTYFDIIPTELSDIIISFLDTEELEYFLNVFTEGSRNINWRFVFFLRFGIYQRNIGKTDHLQWYQRFLDIENLKNKFELNLSIEELDTSIELNLSDRSIVEVPSEIKSLINLKRLNLSHNQIKDIPSFIGFLINLEFINFEFNQIGNVPDMSRLINLRTLLLGYNPIKDIPLIIKLLPKLVLVSVGEFEYSMMHKIMKFDQTYTNI
jgi:hypothetical protein